MDDEIETLMVEVRASTSGFQSDVDQFQLPDATRSDG